MTDRWIDYIRVDDLERAPRNPKTHDAETIRASMERFGYVEAIAVDERTGRLVAGHGRLDDLETAMAAGEDPPDGVRVADDGMWVAPVQRGWSSANDEEAEAYVVTSNQATIAGGWHDPTLAAILTDLQDGAGLAGVGFTDTDLEELFARTAHPPPPSTGDPDHAPPLAAAPDSTDGDVWLCGPHRVVCGDATSPHVIAVATLDEPAHAVWTDPPYGVDYEGGSGLTLSGDGRNLDDLHALLDAVLGNAADASRPGAAWYVAGPAGPNSIVFATVLTDLGIWRQTLVWVKDRFVLGHSDYHYKHEVIFAGDTPDDGVRIIERDPEDVGDLTWTPDEPDEEWVDPDEDEPVPDVDPPEAIFYGWRPGKAHRPPRERTHDTVWEVPRPTASKDHPTMKPVALIAKALEISTLPGQLVLDPFAGSGSTLIAAAATGRRAALVEIDPLYIDVICKRWFEFTGQPAVHAETGRHHPATP